MVYFTSDLHLGHANIIKLCSRPFGSVEEMDEYIISAWNKKVKKGDKVYIIGDFIWQKEQNPQRFLSRLNGEKILVVGNHDTTWLNKVQDKGLFNLKVTEKIVEICHEQKIITLSHYPMLEWKNSRKLGSKKLGYLLHGHIHNNIREEYNFLFKKENALNVGVDINNFEPVTLQELLVNNSLFKLKVLKNN